MTRLSTAEWLLVSVMTLAVVDSAMPQPLTPLPTPLPEEKKPAPSAFPSLLPPPPNFEHKDPTAPSQKLKDIMNPPGKVGTAAAVKLPNLVLRGRVVGNDQPASALLEVDGKVHLIVKGTALTGGNTILRVLEIDSSEVRIEIQGLREFISLR